MIGTRHERLSFLANTFINHDTESLVAAADAESMEVLARRIKDSHRFDGVKPPPDLKRKFDNLRLSVVLAAPPEAAEREELAKIAAAMKRTTARPRHCRMVTPPQPAQPQAQATTPGAPPPPPRPSRRSWCRSARASMTWAHAQDQPQLRRALGRLGRWHEQAGSCAVPTVAMSRWPIRRAMPATAMSGAVARQVRYATRCLRRRCRAAVAAGAAAGSKSLHCYPA